MFKLRTILLLFTAFLIIGLSNAQETLDEVDSVEFVKTLLSPSEIPTKITKISKRLIEIYEIIQPDENVLNTDLMVRYKMAFV